jgi:hypothetical protein
MKKICWQECAGWVCTLCVGYQYFFYPFFHLSLSKIGVDLSNITDTSKIIELIALLLGLGTLKTYEKKKGLNNDQK